MAEIIFGMAVSHGPLLDIAPDIWTTHFRNSDRANPVLWHRKRNLSYDLLVEERQGENLEQFMTLEEVTRRHAACRRALGELMRVYHEVKPDVLVIIGNDHGEIFHDVTPAFGIYTAATHENGPVRIAQSFVPGAPSPGSFFGPGETISHPGLPHLAEHVILALQENGFDPAVISKTPKQPDSGPVVPHAFGFIYHHLLADRPPPSLPVHMNTFFPPNQPTVERVADFSRVLVRAIESWDSDLRIAIVGSGGLSHFIVDEQLDRQVLDALQTDYRRLGDIDELFYQSGSSEIKHWIPVAVAMEERQVPMTLIDYVPCYRSPAGNGQGMAFAYWRP